jgi:hypothetical protein
MFRHVGCRETAVEHRIGVPKLSEPVTKRHRKHCVWKEGRSIAIKRALLRYVTPAWV